MSDDKKKDNTVKIPWMCSDEEEEEDFFDFDSAIGNTLDPIDIKYLEELIEMEKQINPHRKKGYTEYRTDPSWINRDIEDEPKKCKHKWKAIQLSFKTVYDCELCGAKQEDIKK